MITPRRTRLVRVPDLHAFRRAISTLWVQSPYAASASRLLVVPTRGAGRQLRRTLQPASDSGPDLNPGAPELVTREQLYDRLHALLPQPPRRLTAFERDAIAQAAAVEASAEVALPFQLRPGLVAEIVRFYDQLRRHSHQITHFERHIEDAFGGATGDAGAERMLLQTRFLARTFRGYERRVLECGACDEHGLRDRLLTQPTSPPLRHIVATVADWIADPDGLFVADFDLLARMPGLEAIDIVCTEAVLGSGFHERLHNWWPELDEAAATDITGAVPRVSPILMTPAGASQGESWFTLRDREEELVAVARRIKTDPSVSPDRTAVVYKQPLPYLYLAPEAFGAAAIPYQTSDGLPLASEPTSAAVDLVLDLIETSFARDAIVALLASPHFRFGGDSPHPTREAVSALDRALSDARYLGDAARLEELATRWETPDALPALDAARAAARELALLQTPAPASVQVRQLLTFIHDHARPFGIDDPFAPRERRARAAIGDLLERLADARQTHHDPIWTSGDLAAAVRRWIQDETFVPESTAAGVHLLDDQAARYGEFDDMAIVGLIDNEWPERPRRNVFYPPALLKTLGWPTERDRRAAADARFLDLLGSASRRVTLSTITLDSDALVVRSTQLDEVPRARLSRAPAEGEEIIVEMDEGVDRDWAAMRGDRPPLASQQFHGSIGPQERRAWSVSALETYLGCPFKFFAQHVLRLEEEPDDEEVMNPRRQGEFVHEVFEAFFTTWQESGHGAISAQNLDEARTLFTATVDRALQRLPDAEAALERTRLLGSSAAAGLGEAVLRMEAERRVAVVERLLEHRLAGDFTVATASGPRTVAVRGKADRLDLLADGSFRLIDYKLGWPPDRGRALQLPIYSVCAEQRLAGYLGRRWTLGEATYLAFKGPKRVVPLFTGSAQRDEVLTKAQQRLVDTIDAIERGDFPPTPDDVYRCDTCSFASVCRKDYVGDT